MTYRLDRRSFLARSAALGCSLAASPLLTPVSFAAAPWDARLVVIILRGGMDGLDVVQPYGDPGFAAARAAWPSGPESGAADLDGFFALHPGLAPLLPLWRAEELGFVHAVSTPYRDKRSHFDGQDMLEAGTASLAGVRDGWLNRLLQAVPGVETSTAYAIGREDMRLLSGSAPVANWLPGIDLEMSPQARRLALLVMESDPAFHAALNEAMMILDGEQAVAEAGAMSAEEEAEAGMQMGMVSAGANAAHRRIADFAAEQLRGASRIAAFSINGWDTHRAQERGLSTPLGRLSDTILTLRARMGAEVWDKTAVLAMTEFGRTVRPNGTGGTDHGTGGLMLMAGGAVRGGRVHGRWPGLDEADLYQRRDLMPTADLRVQAAWAMRGLTGLDRATLERAVFPGIEMGGDPGLLR
ncbi:MAG TPA: twin-arginine translocation pathway signal [Rhodobacteraceae bacterium]|nr:twin-arginine translocation pathway signal [Paracoccaceae bacterium]